MRITLFSLLICLFYINAVAASSDTSAPKPKYNISFSNKGDTIYRSKEKEDLWVVEILASGVPNDALKGDTISVDIDKKMTTFPVSNYEVVSALKGKSINDLDNTTPIRIIIKKEGESFKQVKPLEIVLKLTVKKEDGKVDDDSSNQGKYKEARLVLMPSDEPLYSYKYLGYIGTNFDLVDGVQAKNLFFATNIFIPETKKWGISLGVYGNRTMTKTDTSKQTTFESRILKINNDSIARYFDTAFKVTTRVSDNIGAYFMPLIPIKCLSDGALKFYYAPQFEFIWRRTTIENDYLNNKTVKIDSSRSRFPANTAFPLITPLSTKVNFNVYDAYLGLLGVLLRYETEDISVRVNSSVGVNFNYVPLGALSSDNGTGNPSPVNPVYHKDQRFFFFGRLWITEPTTGLTLGAEISNYFGKTDINGTKTSKAQPYYNVTLSKAFNLKNLAAVVKPLTSR